MPRPKKEIRVWRPQGSLETPVLPTIFWIQPIDKTEPPVHVKGFNKEQVFNVFRLDDPTCLYIFYFKSYWQEVSEPKYEVNTRIKTWRPMTPNADWDNTSIRGRKWGNTGIIKVLHKDWCEVLHDDGTKGDYQYSELIPLL